MEPKRHPERPKRDPRAAKSGPRVAQERPKSSQERPKSDQERPKSGQERPKGEPELRRWAQERPRRAQDGPGPPTGRPKSAQTPPRTPSKAPQEAPRSFQERLSLAPRAVKFAPRPPQRIARFKFLAWFWASVVSHEGVELVPSPTCNHNINPRRSRTTNKTLVIGSLHALLKGTPCTTKIPARGAAVFARSAS